MMLKQEFDFGGDSVSDAYDSVLVPLLFEPWADHMLQTLPPQRSWSVLDMATGTGIVAQKLARQLEGAGSVIGVDVSSEMLNVASRRCGPNATVVTFIESPAHPLRLNDNSVDAIYCQQGFQFFPAKSAAAKEMYRVLRTGGRIVISTWCPVDECEFFGLICKVLRRLGEDEVADLMSMPFDFMAEEDLVSCFSEAGFENLVVERCEKNLIFDGGIMHACQTVYSTPIAPRRSSLRTMYIEARSITEVYARLVGFLNDYGVDLDH